MSVTNAARMSLALPELSIGRMKNMGQSASPLWGRYRDGGVRVTTNDSHLVVLNDPLHQPANKSQHPRKKNAQPPKMHNNLPPPSFSQIITRTPQLITKTPSFVGHNQRL